MMGITPDAFSFSGMYCRAPITFFSYPPEAVLLAYCTGICLTAIVKYTLAKMTKNQMMTSINMNMIPPVLLVVLETNS